MIADDAGWYWGICLTGIGVALALGLIGVAVVVRRGLALKARLEAYSALPVLALANRTRAAVFRLPQTIDDSSQLVPRMQRALIDLQNARDSFERSAVAAAAGAKAVRNVFANRGKR